jgi:ParB/RepB/Spo0J family partition protein
MPKVIGGGLQRAKDLAQGGQGDPRLQELKIIPIGKIRPGFFQSRLVVDPEKDDRLRKRMQADLKDGKVLRHVFPVVVDPDDVAYFNPKMGGHRRLKIAQELGLTEVCVWIDDYDTEELARGTYTENDPATRQDLNIVEEGVFFQRALSKLGWTQTELAEKFEIEGGQSHVSRCIQAASYAPDIQQMLFREPDRGMRAAVILNQLEGLGEEKAKELRKPLIAAYLAENPRNRLSTDALQIAVDRILTPSTLKEEPAEALPPVIQLRRLERISGVDKSLERLKKEIGNGPPTPEERQKLRASLNALQEILARS